MSSKSFSFDPVPLMKQRFTVLKVLGTGAFGEALLVIDNANRKHMVVKRLKHRIANQKETEQCLAEIKTSQSIDHLNVVKFHQAWIDSSDGHLHILLEYCDGGDLDQFVRNSFPLPESLVVQVFAQLLIGLDHLHVKHFIHRDIKLQNVLLLRTPFVAKFADFGLSKSMSNTDDAAHTCLGTPLYFSPEIASMKEYTRKTDVWSLGVLMYYVLTNRFPFEGRSLPEVFERIRTQTPTPPHLISKQYSPELSKLVMKLLTKSRSARPTPRELLSNMVFDEVLRAWPWQPSWKGAKCYFVAREDCKVNIRAKPSMLEEIVGILFYGDQIIADQEVTSPDGNVMWYRIISPREGYCISVSYGKLLFQAINNPAKASPISSPLPRAADVSPLRRTPSLSPQRQNDRAPSPLAHRTPPVVKQDSPLRRPLSPLRDGFFPRPGQLPGIAKAAVVAPLAQSPRVMPSPTNRLPRQQSPLRRIEPQAACDSPLRRPTPPRTPMTPFNNSPLRRPIGGGG